MLGRPVTIAISFKDGRTVMLFTSGFYENDLRFEGAFAIVACDEGVVHAFPAADILAIRRFPTIKS